MDTVRYHAALLTLVTFIPGILFWPFAHGLVHSWRQLGLVISYSVLGALLIAIGTGVFLLRHPLLAVEFGPPGWLGLPAVLCFVAALTVEVQCRRHLTLRTLVGIPELSPSPTGQPLLDRGIYARLRHPRYVVVILSVFAVALFYELSGCVLPLSSRLRCAVWHHADGGTRAGRTLWAGLRAVSTPGTTFYPQDAQALKGGVWKSRFNSTVKVFLWRASFSA